MVAGKLEDQIETTHSVRHWKKANKDKAGAVTTDRNFLNSKQPLLFKNYNHGWRRLPRQCCAKLTDQHSGKAVVLAIMNIDSELLLNFVFIVSDK